MPDFTQHDTPPVVLAVGGSDSGGGAGIQADIKTIAAHGLHALTAVTAVTAQNTHTIEASFALPADLVRSQIDAVVGDVDPGGFKTGFLGTASIVVAVTEAIAHWRPPVLVVDPVMVSRHGSPIIDRDAREAYERLLRQATICTPNHREAAMLAGRTVDDVNTLVAAAETIATAVERPVLATGGHMQLEEAVDVLVTPDGTMILRDERIDTTNVHGTGCTLASSIAVRLVLETSLVDAVTGARTWVRRAIESAARWHIGSGEGPVDHQWSVRNR